MTSKKLAIGIDLGTTYSCVAVLKNGKVEVIANDSGSRTTPSCVAFSETERYIGEAAINQASKNLTNTIFDVKRLIGREYEDETVQKDIKHWPFHVIDDKGKPKIRTFVGGIEKCFCPEAISSMVLARMKETAEIFLGETITSAVITVPAYFNNHQRTSTIEAARSSGLEVLSIINEPTAAAMAFGFEKIFLKKQQKVLVFDLGGGTFDVSILSIMNGEFKVLATGGDTHLGGDDFDIRLIDHCIKECKLKYKVDIGGNKRVLSRLRNDCQKAKQMLSTIATANVEIMFNNEEYFFTITRPVFETINEDLFLSTIECVKKVLKDAKLEKAVIDEVVLVGGSTRIPKIRAMLQDFFGGKVANQTVNPDEAVAIGAAIHAAVLSNKISNVTLKDVTPLSLGTSFGKDRRMSVLIPRNTAIPATETERFYTLKDYQTVVDCSVYEGERNYVKDNHFLGGFKLSGIKPNRAGKEKIDVTFAVDSDGILTVSAVDKHSKEQKQITITNKSHLTKTEIEQMVADAEHYRTEDEKSRKKNSVKIALESWCFKVKKFLSGTKNISEIDEKQVAQQHELATLLLKSSKEEPLRVYERRLAELESLCLPIIARYNEEKESLQSVD